MKITLKTLSNVLQREKDTYKLFKSYDLNNDGVINKEEFLYILNNLKDSKLNDSQKISIIKIADKNRDDSINYQEFMEFLELLKDETNLEEKIINNNKSEFIEKIVLDMKKLKESVEHNKRNLGEVSKDKFKSNLFSLQEEFYNQFNDYNNLESEFSKLDFSNGEFLISNENFISILQNKCENFEEIKEKLINFSFENVDSKMKKKLTSNENINYKEFLLNLISFKYGKSKEELLLKKKQEDDTKRKILEEKKKQEEKKVDSARETKINLSQTTKIAALKNKDNDNIEVFEPILEDKKFSATTKIENNPVSKELQTKNKELPAIKEKPTAQELKKQKLLELKKQKEEERKRILEEKKKVESEKNNSLTPVKKMQIIQEEEKSVNDNESIGEVVKIGRTQSFKISSNILKEINKDKFKAILDNANNLIKVNIDFNSPESIEKAQKKLISAFAINSDEFKKIKQTIEDKLNFLNFIINIISFDYKGYDYIIDPEKDYFKRPDGKKIETILNSEDAAIKKCEELFNKIKDDEYLDKDFGPQPNDAGVGNKFSLYINGTCPKGHMDPSVIDWYRMTDISPEKSPVFFDDTIDTNDVMQGALGDCWFISALSVIATKDHLLRGQFEYSIVDDGDIDDLENIMLSTGVYPPIFHRFRSKNLFCFKFFKNGKWRYVIIDDKLPCRKIFQKGQVPKLIYARCRNENEFWVPLIEKAYAKLHGSYESLISGFIDDGLVDLTGYVARKMFISQEQIKDPQLSDQLWSSILACTKITFKPEEDPNPNIQSKLFGMNNSMLGCSVDAKVVESELIFQGHKSGVLAGHAYAVLDAFEIEKKNPKKRKKSRLLRIRNPWGFKEWNGKWSDESEEIDLNKEA